MKKKRLTKKGISPLIATVLLIGFTVAIVALVIIWGRSYTEEKAEKEAALAKAKLNCENIDFTVVSASRSGSTITLGIKNRGSTSLETFVFRVNEGGAVVESAETVGGMQTSTISISDAAIGDLASITKVEVIPKIRAARGVFVPCSTKAKKVTKVQES